jgi:hypothetical protein
MNEELIQKLYDQSKVIRKTSWGDEATYFDYNKFAELIVMECRAEVERCTIRNGDTEHNRALGMAWDAINKRFGVK